MQSHTVSHLEGPCTWFHAHLLPSWNSIIFEQGISHVHFVLDVTIYVAKKLIIKEFLRMGKRLKRGKHGLIKTKLLESCHYFYVLQ